uniref:(northern house mosquito) hypothetical protein n=1 Tax=Culex pipiens TaxID=7175 RepID=A0A8D8BDR0_CULPI
MTATAAAGLSSALKEQTQFVMVVVVVAVVAAGFASMADADSGVVAGIAFAGDELVVAAASTLVAGSVVAAAQVVVRVGVACASREVVELLVAAAAGFAIDGVDEDCAAVVGEFAGPLRPCSYRLDCCTAVRRADLVAVVEWVVSQASFAMAVSGWRCRSTVRSVERAGVADGTLVIRAGAARGSASVADAGSRVAVVGEVVVAAAAVALRGERFR